MRMMSTVGVALCAVASLPNGAAWGGPLQVDGEVTLEAAPFADAGLFGISVAFNGERLAVGASDDSSAASKGGAVYVFDRRNGQWGQPVRVLADDAFASDFLGYSVAFEGDVLVAGAWGVDDPASLAGAVYVFERNLGGTNAWGQRAKLMPPGAAQNDVFGEAVALSGDWIAAGAPLDNSNGVVDCGTVSLFRRDGVTGDWSFTQRLVAPDLNTDGNFGISVAMVGDLLAIGAVGSNGQGNGAGAVYLYRRGIGGANSWGFVTKLTGSDVDANDQFGHAVSIDGSRLAVGAIRRDRLGVFAGAVYLFEEDEGGVGAWGEVASVQAATPVNLQAFGSSVRLLGDMLVVGAPDTPGLQGDLAGVVYVFVRDPETGVWDESLALTTEDPDDGDLYGSSVAVRTDGDGWLLAGGARGDGGPTNPLTGSVRVSRLTADAAVECVADLAAPEGVLNFFDIQAFISLFNAHDARADLAAPVGVFNFFDIQAYIGLYNVGCP